MELVRISEAMLAGAVFSQIRSDQARFPEMRVEGGTMVWPNGADLCPDVLIWGGLPPVDTAAQRPKAG